MIAKTQPEITFSGFKLLRRMTEENTTPHRLQWVWEQISQKCDYAFTDFNRGSSEFFLQQFLDPNVEFFEVGDAGVFIIVGATEKGSCLAHYLFWNTAFDSTQRRQCAVEILDYLFFEKKVHRVAGMIPFFNQHAVRFALSVGMKYEGELREEVCSYGKFYNMYIYGMLERDYRDRRERLV